MKHSKLSKMFGMQFLAALITVSSAMAFDASTPRPEKIEGVTFSCAEAIRNAILNENAANGGNAEDNRLFREELESAAANSCKTKKAPHREILSWCDGSGCSGGEAVLKAGKCVVSGLWTGQDDGDLPEDSEIEAHQNTCLSADAESAVESALAPLSRRPIGMSVGTVKVKGKTANDMLRDFAKKEYGDEVEINFHMSAEDLPESDDSSKVGFARIVDVVGLAYDPMGNFSEEEDKKLRKVALKALFDARAAGGVVGVQSSGFTACGVHVPGVIVVVPAEKVVYTIAAKSGC